MSSFKDRIISERILFPLGLSGLYGRSEVFENVVNGLDQHLIAVGRGLGAEAISFPPAIAAVTIETSGYYKSFPTLLGGVQTVFRCSEQTPASLEAWNAISEQSQVMLTPAACYPVYPLLKDRGALPQQGAHITVMSYCFRAEPSEDLHRQQSFRMREFVLIGQPEEVSQFRTDWFDRSTEFLSLLGLEGTREVANDPFFGKEGRIMKINQRELELKHEFLLPVDDDTNGACISFNNHLDSMARKWGLVSSVNEPIHSGCVAFGLERLALAMFYRHGTNTTNWPAETRSLLGLRS